MSDRTIRVCVAGAGGYSGAETIGLLLAHPGVELVGLFGSDRRAAGAAADRFDSLFPRFRGATDLRVEPASIESILSRSPAAVFLATPHEASQELVPALLAARVVVFDLSAAFRLRDPSLYPLHYGGAHPHPELLAAAVYGLPEIHRDSIATASLVACPGCYPTSVILPIAPLARAGLLRPGSPLIVDSASGVSGAGRAAALKSHFCEVSFQPYGVLRHRHGPEMTQECGTEVLFTPHLMALDRGIVSTIHPVLAAGAAAADVRRMIESAYAGEPFVRVLPEGLWPSIDAVAHTNHCDIAVGSDASGRHVVICSAIDNLVKGAGGQAVQAFNIRFGFDQALGLPGGGSRPATRSSSTRNAAASAGSAGCHGAAAMSTRAAAAVPERFS